MFLNNDFGRLIQFNTCIKKLKFHKKVFIFYLVLKKAEVCTYLYQLNHNLKYK